MTAFSKRKQRHTPICPGIESHALKDKGVTAGHLFPAKSKPWMHLRMCFFQQSCLASCWRKRANLWRLGPGVQWGSFGEWWLWLLPLLIHCLGPTWRFPTLRGCYQQRGSGSMTFKEVNERENEGRSNRPSAWTSISELPGKAWLMRNQAK